MDNSEYTVILKNAAGSALNGTGYKVILPKQPRLTSSLTLADFPTVTNVSIDGNTNVTPRSMTAGKSLAVSWTLPVGMSTNYAHVWTSDSMNGQQYFVSKNLTSTATSTLLALETAPAVIPDVAQLRVQAKDAFGRQFGVSHYQKIYPGMPVGGVVSTPIN